MQFRRTELLSRMQRALVNAAGGAPPPSAATGMIIAHTIHNTVSWSICIFFPIDA
jgi:hypothetical protein